ncbi:MAG: hypothetical protein WKG07_15585 [Hymenobacter sp.]
MLSFVKPGVWEFEIEAEIVHEFRARRARGGRPTAASSAAAKAPPFCTTPATTASARTATCC